jgi:hypothetical protein
MDSDEIIGAVRRFADAFYTDREPDTAAMDDALRALVQLGPDRALDVLHEFEQHELVSVTLWAMQAAAERGYGLRAGPIRHGQRR